MAHYATPGQFHRWYPQQEATTQHTVKDQEKYSFAECLVWQTMRTFNPQFNFQRSMTYTPLYTESIQKFTLGTFNSYLDLYATYLPTADVVLHRFKKVLQPIIRYQKTIGYEALELLVFSSFLGFYCSRLFARGIEEAPDYAVIAIANALKFFDDTDQFEDDGWVKIEGCARNLIATPRNTVNAMVSISKMGERIEQYLKVYLDRPPQVPFRNISKEKAISYTTDGLQNHQTPQITANSEGHETSTVAREASTVGHEISTVVREASTVGRKTSTGAREASTVGREICTGWGEALLRQTLTNFYRNMRTGPLYS